MAYPQNGDRIVAIDSVTSLHPMDTPFLNRKQTTLQMTSHVKDVGLPVSNF